MKDEVLRIERVDYEENGHKILRQLELNVLRGEIIGAAGCDNQQKSALLRLIKGGTPVTRGTIYYGGRVVNSREFCQRENNDVVIIGEKRSLVENMSVAENVFVIKGSYKKILVNKKKLERQFTSFVREKNIPYLRTPDALVHELNEYEKALIELTKAVIFGRKLIILDNISDRIGSSNMDSYFNLIRAFAAEGHSFLYLCSNINEARLYCDKSAIVEKGSIKRVVNSEKNTTSVFQYNDQETEECNQSPLLRLQDLEYKNIKGLSFSVYPQEWISLIDVDNTMIENLLTVLSGDSEAMKDYKGKILYDGREFRDFKGHSLSREIAFVTEDPTKTMVFSEMSYMDNLCFRLEDKKLNAVIKRKYRSSIRKEYGAYVGEDIDVMDITTLDTISLYRLVYYSIHLSRPQVVFCIRPFMGADAKIRSEIEKLLCFLHDRGIAIVELLNNVSNLYDVGKKRILYVGNEFI